MAEKRGSMRIGKEYLRDKILMDSQVEGALPDSEMDEIIEELGEETTPKEMKKELEESPEFKKKKGKKK